MEKHVRAFIEVHKLCLIMFPLIFVLRLYNLYIYIYNGDICDIMVIIILCGLGYLSSNPEQGCLHFPSH